MRKSFEGQIFKVTRVVDKVELALDEMIFESKEENFDPLNPEAVSWIDQVKIKVSSMVNCFLRSYILDLTKRSLSEMMLGLDKYYSVLPLESLNEREEQLFASFIPITMRKRRNMRRALLLDYVEGVSFEENFVEQFDINEKQKKAFLGSLLGAQQQQQQQQQQ